MQENRMETKPPASTVELQQQQQPAPPGYSNKSRWQRFFVWAALLLTFGVIFMLALRHHDETQSAASSRRGVTGPVTVVTAVAQRGTSECIWRRLARSLRSIPTRLPVRSQGWSPRCTIRKANWSTRAKPWSRSIRVPTRPALAGPGALERDTHVLEQAQMDLQRYRDAWARNGIPKQTLDDQEKFVLQDEGTVKNDQGTVHYDQVQVGWCHITAPIAGRVGLRLVDPGNVVQSSGTTTLGVITEAQPITVVFTVAEDSLPQVLAQTRHGKRLEVDAFDRAQLTQIATGKLLTLDNQIDTTTGTVKLRALFDNKDDGSVPQPVREHQAAGEHSARGHADSDFRHST